MNGFIRFGISIIFSLVSVKAMALETCEQYLERLNRDGLNVTVKLSGIHHDDKSQKFDGELHFRLKVHPTNGKTCVLGHDPYNKPFRSIYFDRSVVIQSYAGQFNGYLDGFVPSIRVQDTVEVKPDLVVGNPFFANDEVIAKLLKSIDVEEFEAVASDGFQQLAYLGGEKFGLPHKQDDVIGVGLRKGALYQIHVVSSVIDFAQ